MEDFVGTVENIGLRSTRIRTLDRTVISMPNSRLADQRLETFAARDRYRLSTTIGLIYESTQAQVRQVRDGFERVLRAHPKIWPDAVAVRFVQFSAVLLAFMGVVEEAKTSIAYPTQTLYLNRPAGAA